MAEEQPVELAHVSLAERLEGGACVCGRGELGVRLQLLLLLLLALSAQQAGQRVGGARNQRRQRAAGGRAQRNQRQAEQQRPRQSHSRLHSANKRLQPNKTSSRPKLGPKLVALAPLFLLARVRLSLGKVDATCTLFELVRSGRSGASSPAPLRRSPAKVGQQRGAPIAQLGRPLARSLCADSPNRTGETQLAGGRMCGADVEPIVSLGRPHKSPCARGGGQIWAEISSPASAHLRAAARRAIGRQ